MIYETTKVNKKWVTNDELYRVNAGEFIACDPAAPGSKDYSCWMRFKVKDGVVTILDHGKYGEVTK